MNIFIFLLILLSGKGNLGKPFIYPESDLIENYGELLLEEDIRIEVNKEKKEVVLYFDTSEEVLPVSSYYGIYRKEGMPSIIFRRLAYREDNNIKKHHKVTMNLSMFELPKYDFCEFKKKGGVIYYRLELINPHYKVCNIYDGRFKIDEGYRRVPCVIIGPFVDMVSTDGAVISFETDIPSRGEIHIEDRIFSDNVISSEHEIRIDGLIDNKKYSYSVIIDNELWGKYKFKTAPEDEKYFKFAVLSDSRAAAGGGEYYYGESCNRYILSRLVLDAYRKGADFIIFAGDLINGYVACESDFRQQLRYWKNSVEKVGAYIPIYEGMGNHEALIDVYEEARFDKKPPVSTEDIFRDEFVNPENGPESEGSLGEDSPTYKENVYYFDYGNSRFISFNTNYAFCSNPGKFGGNLEGYIMDEQLYWIESILRDAEINDNIENIFLYSHEPSFPNGGHLKDAQWYNGKKPFVIDRRDSLWRIVSNNSKVVSVFYGDEHNYHRMLIDRNTVLYEDEGYIPENPMIPENPVWQIVTGGAGAPSYGRESAPWSLSVRSFYPGFHYCMVEVIDGRVQLEVLNENGEIVDRCVLRR